MADDAAAVLRGLGVTAAHVAGFSGGSVIARELTRRHPELVKSLVLVGTFAYWDTFARTAVNAWRWQAEAAPSERAFLESFYTWIYTPRAHEDGMVRQIIDEAAGVSVPDLDGDHAAHDRRLSGPRGRRSAGRRSRSRRWC